MLRKGGGAVSAPCGSRCIPDAVSTFGVEESANSDSASILQSLQHINAKSV